MSAGADRDRALQHFGCHLDLTEDEADELERRVEAVISDFLEEVEEERADGLGCAP